VNINAMTTTSGTPNNQRMIGMEGSLAIDPAGSVTSTTFAGLFGSNIAPRVARAGELEPFASRRC
jgi:hypothetical protein